MLTKDSLKQLNDIDKVLEALLENVPKKVLDDAAHDALLNDLFGMVEDFHKTVFIPDEVLNRFKSEIDDEKTKEEVKDIKNVDRIIDTIVKNMTKEEKVNEAKRVLKTLWFEENVKGDLPSFIDNLKNDFWNLS